ncbi:uncharacterized protein LOC132273765 [Cornus florida]|uniref:uncharacterized protein LOC132273765 n=1 Tax=Cornus florida TaxID=4283 RepID=UPI00289C1D07|nr:uncharacterized protein LOC132273765 [Cornus florida]
MKIDLRKAFDTSNWDFIQGRQIEDSILIAQELLNGYHTSICSPRCTMKIDLRKAFDTSNWDFILDTLKLMGFPAIFITWVESYITTTSFTVSLNGEFHGHFKGAKGLRSVPSLQTLLRATRIFSNLSGLHGNQGKSQIFLSGVALAVEFAVLNIAGFEQGCLPIRYLGVPLISTMLKDVDCKAIINKEGSNSSDPSSLVLKPNGVPNSSFQ